MTLIDAFVNIDGDLYHVSGPIDTNAHDWFETAQKEGTVKLSLPAIEIKDDIYTDLIRHIKRGEKRNT